MPKKQIPESKPRLQVVDMMVGLAMVLVVVGHASFNFTPQWYNGPFHAWIYAFHMEVFIFLSALLIRYSYRGVHSLRDYVRYEGRKVLKFGIPFFVMGSAVGLCSAWLNGVLPQTGAGRVLWAEVRQLVQWPMQSHASFLWYIYVLMGFYLISPLYFRLPQWAQMALCVVAMAISLLPVSYRYGGALFARYAPFYCLGVLCAQGVGALRAVRPWQWAIAALPFVAWSVGSLCGRVSGLSPLFTGFIALPAVALAAMGCLRVRPLQRALEAISRGCYWIYLLQLPVAWGCAIVWRECGLPERLPFVLFLLLSSALCLALPIAMQKGWQRLSASHTEKRNSKRGSVSNNQL